MKIELAHLKTMRLRPGDTLVLRTEQWLTPQAQERLAEQFRGFLDRNGHTGIPVVVLAGGLDLAILREEKRR